jgi:hypothetical protein
MKLELNKETILQLNEVEMSAIEGGLMWTTSFGNCQSSCCPPPTGYTVGNDLCCTSEDTDSCIPSRKNCAFITVADAYDGATIPNGWQPLFDANDFPVLDGTSNP